MSAPSAPPKYTLKGGQRRTYICPCGWGTKDSVRGSDYKMKLHMKICGAVQNFQPTAFNACMNGANGLQATRQGNLQYRPLIGIIRTNDNEIAQLPLAEIMNTRIFLLNDQKEQKE
jgi:hypothetical protein